jgi:hypothetical protein
LNIPDAIAKSKYNKGLDETLKRFILSIVDEALINVYGPNYSTRCLQSSIGVQKILTDFGIKSKLQLGACCFSIVKGNQPYQVSWGGFWDKYHHVWLITEFFELVDFTISKLHQHPSQVSDEIVHPLPVIWWSPIDICPPIFRYLPYEFNAEVSVDLLDIEKNALANFLTEVELIKNRKLHFYDSSLNYVGTILSNPAQLEMLYESGNSWLLGSLMIQEQNIGFPAWIQSKERALNRQIRE